MEYLKTYFLDVITKHYFDFNGRDGRKLFWLFLLNLFVVNLILELIFPWLFNMIISLALLLPFIGLIVRRLHDINLNGWLVLICFVPFIGVIVLITFGCIPGTEGENKYGPANAITTEIVE